MTELMCEHVSKDREYQDKSLDGLLRSVREIAGGSDPDEEQQKGHVDANIAAEKSRDREGPSHDNSRSFALRRGARR